MTLAQDAQVQRGEASIEQIEAYKGQRTSCSPFLKGQATLLLINPSRGEKGGASKAV